MESLFYNLRGNMHPDVCVGYR